MKCEVLFKWKRHKALRKSQAGLESAHAKQRSVLHLYPVTHIGEFCRNVSGQEQSKENKNMKHFQYVFALPRRHNKFSFGIENQICSLWFSTTVDLAVQRWWDKTQVTPSTSCIGRIKINNHSHLLPWWTTFVSWDCSGNKAQENPHKDNIKTPHKKARKLWLPKPVQNLMEIFQIVHSEREPAKRRRRRKKEGGCEWRIMYWLAWILHSECYSLEPLQLLHFPEL